MIDTKDGKYNAPATAARVVEFRNDGDENPTVIVENLDDTNSIALKYQESDDGNTWTDITGTNATVNPLTGNSQAVVSSKSRIGLHAGGDADFTVKVIRQMNGNPTNLGPIC